jgi:sugar (pentulose or hexulose) kinase
MSIIALDLGSTNLKAALFNQNLERLANHSIPVPYARWQDGQVEMDPEVILNLVLELFESLCQTAGISPGSIIHLTVTSQAQTFLLADKNGISLTPLISWMDTRADSLVDEIKEILGFEFTKHCSFPRIIPELMVAKVFWFKKHLQPILDRAQSILPFPSWLMMHLGFSSHIDHNLAAMSGLYTLRENDWWDNALGLCGIGRTQLPDLIQGSVDKNNQTSTPEHPFSFNSICYAGNDQTCGAISSQLQQDELLLTLGTTWVAYRLAGNQPGPYHPEGCWGPYPPGGYYELIALSPSTNIFKPLGVHSPIGKEPETRSSISVPQQRCFELYRMVTSSWNLPDFPKRILVAGGGSHDNMVLQMLSDLFNKTICRTTADPLLGAAIQSRSALPGSKPAITHIFNPQSDHIDQVLKRYQQWKN